MDKVQSIEMIAYLTLAIFCIIWYAFRNEI